MKKKTSIQVSDQTRRGKRLEPKWLPPRTRIISATRRMEQPLLVKLSTNNSKISINIRASLRATWWLTKELRKESHSDIPLIGPSDLTGCREHILPLIGSEIPWLTIIGPKIIIFNTLMKMPLKCTQRCLISWSTTSTCLTMKSLQRCSLSKTVTTTRNLKTTSKVTNQVRIETNRIPITNNSRQRPSKMVPPLERNKSNSNNTITTWVISCLCRAGAIIPYTSPVMVMFFRMAQVFNALVDTAGHALSLPLPYSSHLETKESFK